MQIEQLKPIIEAALLAASQPLTVAQLGELFAEEDKVDREAIARALEALGEDCAGRGIELKEVASGFRYQVRQDVHPWVSRMWTEKPSRYSRALLETLALIAYRQPITRPEIEQIRGVVVSSNIVKTLEEREWIRVVGHRDVPGRPALFGTTRAFLDYFNLKSLDELPPLSEIRDMEDPQLRLDQEPLPPRVIKDLPIDPDEDVADAAADETTGLSDATADAGRGETSASGNDAVAGAGTDTTPDDHARAPAEVAADGNAEPTHPIETAAAAPDDEAPAPTPSAAADEAAAQADVETDAAEQDTEEYRA
jgi:segregation and condensation protein B